MIRFVNSRLSCMKKKCDLINEIISQVINHYLGIENIISKQKINKISIQRFFNSDKIVERFFENYSYIIVTSKILYYVPFDYV